MTPAKQLDRVVLEMSFKPFRALDDASIAAVCREALQQWFPLAKLAKECGLLLWISDGSEILTWKGDLSEKFEWARYIGTCNTKFRPYNHTIDPRRLARPYTDNPVEFTYGDIRRIIDTFRRVGREEFGLRIVVGATFDPGPEFAESPFKFELHPEIMGRGDEVNIGATVWMVRTWSRLRGDKARYAAYPDGIPEGTSFGEFFARQCRSFLSTLGFDYIWFSNGFGFSHFGWSELGESFDGERFYPERYQHLSERILDFWRLFRKECNYPIEVRGTNFSTGIDLAKDCVPYVDIYEGGFIRVPPPNYPSGAINYDFGLEMVGYMTRIALLPEAVFPFRYYVNDPWFMANPWRNRYGEEPFDIYIPLSTARLNAKGEVETPRLVEFLSIDTERGVLDESTALEVVPHVRRVLDHKPDAVAPFVWLYPFREYHRLPKEQPQLLDLAYFGDWFIRGALNNGLPLNSVISTDDFPGALAAGKAARAGAEAGSGAETEAGSLAAAVIFTPTPFIDADYVHVLQRHVEQGGKVVFYGPICGATCAAAARLLNLKQVSGLEGDLDFHTTLPDDIFTAWQGERKLRHVSALSGGPLTEVLAGAEEAHTQVLAEAGLGGEKRVYALWRSLPEWQGGSVAWVRDSSSFVIHTYAEGRRAPKEHSLTEFWEPSILLVKMLSRYGYTFRQTCRTPATKRALVFIHRHDNAFYFSGFKADTTVQLTFDLPEGAPIFAQKEAVLSADGATYYLEKSFHVHAHVLVRQKEESMVHCRDLPPLPQGKVRHLLITGLVDADVTIYPPPERWNEIEIRQGQHGVMIVDAFGNGTQGTRIMAENADQVKTRLKLTGITGELSIIW